jgi:hypothetical protein
MYTVLVSNSSLCQTWSKSGTKEGSSVIVGETVTLQPAAKVALQLEEKKAVAHSCSISLLDICRLGHHLVKSSKQSAFAREWAVY